MHAVEDNNVSKVKVYFGHRTCYTVAAAGGGISSNDLTDSMLCDIYIHSLMFVLNDAILRTMIKKKSPCPYRPSTSFNTTKWKDSNSLFDDQIIAYS